MKKTKTLLFFLSMMASVAVTAQEKNIKVVDYRGEGYGQTFVSALGDCSDVDSLVIKSSVYLGDEWASVLCDICQNGRLTGIDLSRCTGISEIPAMAFMSHLINGMSAKTEPADNDYRTNLRYITLPNSVTRIGEYAFANTNLEYIEIPMWVDAIHTGAFAGCENLKNVVFRGKKLHPASDGNGFADINVSAVLHVGPNMGRYYKDSESWTAFADVRESDVAFRWTDIQVLDGQSLADVVSIDDLCADSVTVSGVLDEADMDLLRDNVIYGRIVSLDMTNSTIEDGCLSNCKMDYLRLPRKMSAITAELLGYSTVLNLTLPESYDKIRIWAFCGYTGFPDGTFNVAEGCRRLNYGAFMGCKGLNKIILPSTLDVLEPRSLGLNSYSESNISDVDLYVNRMYPPASTTISEDMDFDVPDAQDYGPFGCFDTSKDTEACLTRTWRLFVPMGAKKNYESAEHWNHFRTIIETPLLTGVSDGIDAVTSDRVEASASDGVYSLDGRMVAKDVSGVTARGLYVVKANGQARKVVMGR